MIYTREKASTIDELRIYLASEDKVKKMAEKGIKDYYRVRNDNDIAVLWKKRAPKEN